MFIANSGRNVRPLVQLLVRGLQVGTLSQAYRPAGADFGSILTTPLGVAYPSPIEQSYFGGGRALVVSIREYTTYACISTSYVAQGTRGTACHVCHLAEISH